MFLSILKTSLINISILIDESSLTVCLVIHPISLILRPILKLENAFSILLTQFIHSFKFISIEVQVCTNSSQISIFPCSLYLIPISIIYLSFSVFLIIQPITMIDTSINIVKIASPLFFTIN